MEYPDFYYNFIFKLDGPNRDNIVTHQKNSGIFFDFTKVVADSSSQLLEAENKCGPNDLECLTVGEGVEKSQPFLNDAKVVNVTKENDG